MAYSITSGKSQKKSMKGVEPYWIKEAGNPSIRTDNPNQYLLAISLKPGWNNVSFPYEMVTYEINLMFINQYNITKVHSATDSASRTLETNTWTGTLTSVNTREGYRIKNDSDSDINLAFPGVPTMSGFKKWRLTSTSNLTSAPILRPTPIASAFNFDNATSQTLRSSGSGSASATTSMVVADGDAPHSGVAEKQYLVLSALNSSQNIIVKKYVICDAGQPGCVATGTVLVEGSDTGGSTISAGSNLIGGIAVSTDLGPATYAVILNELRTAILHANGHNGLITLGGALTPADGTQSISLTQPIKGTRGNYEVINTISNVTVNNFTGGASGTGTFVKSVVSSGVGAIWDSTLNKFVGSKTHIHQNEGVGLILNDLPQAETYSYYRDQGPDITTGLFTAPPYEPVNVQGGWYGDWQDFYGDTLIWVEGHWSYYNDGDPDADYPSNPGDDDYGSYRLWVVLGEWVSGWWNDAYVDQSSTAGHPADILNDSYAFGFWQSLSQSFIFAMQFDWDETPNNGTKSFFRDVNNNPPDTFFDAVGVFKGNYCSGSYPFTPLEGAVEYNEVSGEYELDGTYGSIFTLPIMGRQFSLTYSETFDNEEAWLDFDSMGWFDQGSQVLSYDSKSIVTLASTTVDGTNIPHDDSVWVTLISTDGTTKKYIASGSDDFDHGDGVKFNANQTRDNIYVSLKNAIESSDGHNGKITVVTVGGNANFILAQAVAGFNGDTDVVWGGDWTVLEGTVTTTGDWSSDLYGLTVQGKFLGGGDLDFPRYVYYDASENKYHIMKWHYKNISTGEETMYEYYQIEQEWWDNGLNSTILDDQVSEGSQPPAGFTAGANFVSTVYRTKQDSNYWFLKAMPEGEEW